MAFLNGRFADLQEAAEHLVGRFVLGRGWKSGENVPMAGLIAYQRDGRLVEKQPFCHDLLLEERQQTQHDVHFLGFEDDVCRVVVAVYADVGQFKPDARQHDELDSIELRSCAGDSLRVVAGKNS